MWDDNPYEAHAVRQDPRTWVVGVREIPGDLLRLGVADDAIASLQVAVAPDEERSYFVDGDLIGHELFGTRVDVGTAQALRSLESRGSSRFEAYVVTADRVEDDLWEVRVDPL